MQNAIKSTIIAATAAASFGLPARAQEPSGPALGASIVQWVLLNCPNNKLPESAVSNLPDFVAITPESEMQAGWAYVQSMVAKELGGDIGLGCTLFENIIAREFGPSL